jgi:hypothetical protein
MAARRTYPSGGGEARPGGDGAWCARTREASDTTGWNDDEAGEASDRAVGAARLGHGRRDGAARTRARRCRDDAFKERAWARGAKRGRLADEQTRRGERQADRWDPAAVIF